jgi:hypothetical protein
MQGNRERLPKGVSETRTNVRERYGLTGRATAALALVMVSVFSGMMEVGRILGAVLLQGETLTQAMFDFVGDPWGTLLVVVAIGGAFILLLGIAFHWFHAEPRVLGSVMGLLVIVGIVGVLIASGVATTSTLSITGPPPAGASLSGYLVSAGLQSGCSISTANPSAPVETCDLVYNYTSNYWATSTSNASTCDWYAAACHPRNYIDIPVHEARVDAINGTFGFVYQVGSLYTVTTTGASPTVYSPMVGYIPATGSASGYWLMKWSAGSIATINPSQAAPGVTSAIAQDTVGIAAFGSVSNTLNETLPGAGGSSAPSAMYAAETTYASYSETVTVQDSSPFTFTLTVIPIGEHA